MRCAIRPALRDRTPGLRFVGAARLIAAADFLLDVLERVPPRVRADARATHLPQTECMLDEPLNASHGEASAPR